MSTYVLATDPDERERRRMDLLFRYHGAATIEALQASGLRPGSHALEVGPGGGDITRWLAERVRPHGRVVAVDLETQWIEHLAGPVVEIRRGDFEHLDLPPAGFDVIVAQMLLIHLSDPARACRRFLELAVPGAQIVIHDADFTPLHLDGATPEEAAGIAVMVDVMRSAGIDVAIGPELPRMLEAAGAIVEAVDVRPCHSREDAHIAAQITAITIDRFRTRTSTPAEHVERALAALADPHRFLTGPTRWIVRARVPSNA
jgi:SAM-dependent methyltransferase